MPVEVQRLAFGGQELRDGLRLWDYGIGREATLHMLLRVKGGMPSVEDTLGFEDFCSEWDGWREAQNGARLASLRLKVIAVWARRGVKLDDAEVYVATNRGMGLDREGW